MNGRLTEVPRVWWRADTQGSRGLSSTHRCWAGKTKFFAPWGQIPPGRSPQPFFSYLETVCPRSTWLLGNSTPRTKLLSQPGSAPLTPSFLASATAGARARARMQRGSCMQCKGDSVWSPSKASPREKAAGLAQRVALVPPTDLPLQHGCSRGAKGAEQPLSGSPWGPWPSLGLAYLALYLSEPTLDPLMDTSNPKQLLPFFSSSP